MQISVGERPFTVRNIDLEVPGILTPVKLRPGTSDEPTFIQVFIQRQYEFDFGSLRPGLIIDGGANVGYASLWFKNIFPQSRIIAVEPEPSNCEQYRQNLQGYEAVQLLDGALWSKSGRGSLVTHENGKQLEHWAFKVSDHSRGKAPAVTFYTISEILRMAEASAIDILKLDVEGAEAEIFADGCDAWLGAVKVLILEFHEQLRPNSAQPIINKLAADNWHVSQQGDHFMFKRQRPGELKIKFT